MCHDLLVARRWRFVRPRALRLAPLRQPAKGFIVGVEAGSKEQRVVSGFVRGVRWPLAKGLALVAQVDAVNSYILRSWASGKRVAGCA